MPHLRDQSEDALPPAVELARKLWSDLAAYGWGYYRSMGRGLMVLETAQLEEAVRGQESGVSGVVRPSFVPLDMIPQGDEYRGTVRAYDPNREILLLVRGEAESAPLFFSLGAAGSTRPAPPDCFEAWKAMSDGEGSGAESAQSPASGDGPPRSRS